MGRSLLASVLISVVLFDVFCEDDFVFEQDKSLPLQRLWGIPDTTAYVGHLFVFQVPENAFEGTVARYKAFNENGGPIPEWLHFDEITGSFEGVPMEEDLGEHYIAIKAFDQKLHDSVKDIFALEVLSNPHTHNSRVKDSCKTQEDKTVLTLILDTEFKRIAFKERLTIIKNFIGFFNIHPDSVRISKQDEKDEMLSDSVISAGPGNLKRKTSKLSTLLKWQIGCQGNIWSKFLPKVERAKWGAKDGMLAEVLQHPVAGWTISKDDSEFRKRREVYGSGGEIDADDEEEDDSIPESRVVVTNTATPVFHLDASPIESFTLSASHPHRHHHGDISPTTNTVLIASIMPTPTYIPDRPTSFFTIEKEIQNFSPTFTTVSPSTFILTTQETSTSEKEKWTSMDPQTSEAATPPMPDVSTDIDDLIYQAKNSQPVLNHRLQKLGVTAGKLLRYIVPQDTFFDNEDGNSRNLTISLSDQEGDGIPPSSWVQFDPKTQEIYALPLEEHVSKWIFSLSAVDSGGLSISDQIEISVQHHKGSRTVVHAFSVEILSAPSTIPLNWEVMLLDGIRSVFSDPDTSQITVLSINTTSQPMTFIWTNDSLPRSHCSQKEIEALTKVLNSESGLKSRVDGGLVVGKVSFIGLGQCEDRAPPPKASNFPPVPRNQVDQINATVGQLLIYTVPEDTFYDPEDGSVRNMKLSFVNIDQSPIQKNRWLQFDAKNQEFYGIPISANVGQMEYQLICQDRGGLTAYDSLVVIVHPAPKTMYNVEFSMRLGLEYSTFVESPPLQKNFVQRLATLFEDSNTNAIVLSGISPGSTVVTWHNKSLPTDHCPDEEIRQLRQIMLGDDERVTPTVGRVFGPEFPVLGGRLTPTGLCQGALTEVAVGGGDVTNDVTAISHSEQYILGLIVPAIVITIMLVCAGLVACILYRRKRTGKMSVGDEDERQSFRSKGIPVIFQDELDERPEPTNKSPVIMKEEKPPLPPPEYQRGPPLVTTALLSDTEDSLYQPPPPFTSSRDAARPKPAPTYRMPPPYVPP